MSGRRFLGIILLTIGLISLLNRLELIDINISEIFINYWPLFLVGIGFVNMFTNPTAKMGGLVLVTIGILFQLRVSGYFDIFEFKIIWPLIIILLGIKLLLPGNRRKWNIDDNDTISGLALFSGFNIKNRSPNFQGGNAGALFGGLEIDLRDAKIAPGEAREIELFTAFGGIEVFVPHQWNVVVKGFPLFGGIDNRAEYEDCAANGSTLIIKGTVLFGGIDIKN
ncbi:MAG: LiaF transmembrane domain-containing protein [bacterium]|jgi:predicted membrane protein